MRNLTRFSCLTIGLLVLLIAVAHSHPASVVYAATITVSSADDVVADDGFCTLREAIIAANTNTASGAMAGECMAGNGADTITLSANATYALVLPNSGGGDCGGAIQGLALLCVDSDVIIDSNGATIVVGEGAPVAAVLVAIGNLTINDAAISGGKLFGGVVVTPGGILELNDSVLLGNQARFSEFGGGITNFGKTELNNSAVDQNDANATGQAGGISNVGVLTLNNSTVSGNTFVGNSGAGGIANVSGTVVLNSSTVSENTVVSSLSVAGGGIYNDSGKVTLSSSTISGNSVMAGKLFAGGIIGILGGELILENTIVAGNFALVTPDRNDCFLSSEAFIKSQGHNLFGLLGEDSDCVFTPSTGDQIGTAENPVDAMLLPLTNNGGPTQTHALLSGSPALDAGSCAGAAVDQRVLPRPIDVPGVSNSDDGCDIGALEGQLGATTSIVDGDVDGLLESLVAVNSAISLSTIELAENGDYVLKDGELLVHTELLIEGNGAEIRRSSDEGTPEFRILHVLSTGDLTLNNATISNGLLTDDSEGLGNGGGIWNEGGTLSINHSAITENTAVDGGGIFNNIGTLELINSTVSRNIAGDGGLGGGINGLGGSMTIIGSVISQNNADSEGGGIYIGDEDDIVGTLDMTNSTISGNIGGGLSVVGGAIENTINIFNSTIVNNMEGAGIIGSAPVTLANTIIAHHVSESFSDCLLAENFTSNGFNIDTDGTCNLTHENDLPLTLPFVGALFDHGGPTQTHSLSGGSPAVDAIPPEDCNGIDGSPLTTDQRGVERPQGAGCDIGAFELGPPKMPGDANEDGSIGAADITCVVLIIFNGPDACGANSVATLLRVGVSSAITFSNSYFRGLY